MIERQEKPNAFMPQRGDPGWWNSRLASQGKVSVCSSTSLGRELKCFNRGVCVT